jgi:hypothetical protein
MYLITAVRDPKVRAKEKAKYVMTMIRAMDLGAGFTSHDRFWAALVRTDGDQDDFEYLPFDIGSQRPIMERWIATDRRTEASQLAEPFFASGKQVEPCLPDE